MIAKPHEEEAQSRVVALHVRIVSRVGFQEPCPSPYQTRRWFQLCNNSHFSTGMMALAPGSTSAQETCCCADFGRIVSFLNLLTLPFCKATDRIPLSPQCVWDEVCLRVLPAARREIGSDGSPLLPSVRLGRVPASTRCERAT